MNWVPTNWLKVLSLLKKGIQLDGLAKKKNYRSQNETK